MLQLRALLRRVPTVKKVFALCVILIIRTSYPALAQDAAFPKLTSDVLKVYAITVYSRIDTNSCLVKIKVDEADFESILPKLIERRMLANGMDEGEASQRIVSLEGVWAMNMAAYILKQTYEENPKVNNCHFENHALIADEFGVQQDRLLSSFDFQRSIYKRVNWYNMEARNLMKIALHFTLSDWYAAEFAKEVNRD